MSQIAHKHSLLPPIERIPTEILDTIFTLIHESSRYSLTIYRDPCSVSLPLSQVCFRWRKTIRSRPSLWASISINAEFVHGEIRHILKVHLENAGFYPLRIGLVVRRVPPRPKSTCRNDALQMIVPELWRCEELVFRGEWSELAQVVPLQSSFALPHLRSLYADECLSALIEGMGSVSPTFRWFSHALKTAPKLTTVKTPGIISPAVLPCHQLATVCVMDSKTTQIAHTIRSCPNLKSLEVHFLLADRNPSPNDVHSSLQELTIYTHPDRIPQIVSSFARTSLPELQMFKLAIIRDFKGIRSSILPTSAVIPIIQYFSGYSSVSLQKLVLVPSYLKLDRKFCRDILQICPKLRCFTIEARFETDDGTECILHLFQDLTITNTSQAFLAPKLRELCVHEYMTHITPDYATTFLDMVESRSAGIGVTRLMDAEYRRRRFAQHGLEDINSCVPDSSIVERIRLLSQKGIHCAIGAIRG